MQLDELSITGFGRLAGASFAFQPGLNLILGPNEAGKSTLLQALFSLLYGFFDSGSVTTARRELLESYRPWNASAAYQGALAFRLQNGHRYLVERNFGPARMATSLCLLPGKKDISNQFKSESYGRLYFAEELLGLSRTVFENTCCLRQSELVKLDGSASALTEAIVRLTSSGSANANANSGLEMLRQVLRDEIGTARAWTKPLAAAQKQTEQLRKLYEAEVHNQEQLWSWLQEISQSEARLALLHQQRDKQTYLKLLAEQSERRETVARLEQASQDVERQRKNVAQLAGYADVAVDRRDELLAQAAEWRQLQAAVAQRGNREAELRAQLAQLHSRIAQLNTQAERLGHGLALKPAARDQILLFKSQWENALANQRQATSNLAAADEQLRRAQQKVDTSRLGAQSSIALGTVGLARLQSALEDAARQLAGTEGRYSRAAAEWSRAGMSEDQFEALAARVEALNAGTAPTPPARRGCNFFARSAPPADEKPAETIIFQDIAPLWEAQQAAATAHAGAQQQYSAAEQMARSALGLSSAEPLNDEVFRRKAGELAQLAKGEAEMELLSSSRNEVAQWLAGQERTAKEAAARLLAALKEQGINQQDPALGVESYLQAYDEQAKHDAAGVEADTLRQQSELVADQVSQIEQAQRDLARKEQRIRSLLAEAGIADPFAQPIEQSLEEYRRLCEHHEQWAAAQRVLESSEQQLHLLQKIGLEDGTVHQIEVTERRLRQTLDAHPDWSQLTISLPEAEYARQLHETEAMIDQTQAGAIWLRHQLQSLEERTTSLAELDEQRKTAEGHFAELSRASARYSKAAEMLQEATIEYQKAFAPRLETQIGQRLTRITKGRYQKTRVDPATLSLELWSPESDAWAAAERLSTGTRDLVYVAMRVELSNLLSGGSEPLPLLLDDPFVHLDADREQQALEYIQELAEGCQVLFFSKDLLLKERLPRTNSQPAVLRLGLDRAPR